MSHRRRWKNAAAWLMFTALLLCCPLTFSRAVGASNICYAYASESDEYFWSWCVMVRDGNQVVVFTERDDDYEPESECVVQSGETERYYPMECVSRTPELLLWLAPDAQNDASVLDSRCPVLNESVTVHYISKSSQGVSLQTASRTITGVSTTNAAYAAFLELNQDVDATNYPGFLVNNNGECVGILHSSNEAFISWFDEEQFNSGAATSPSDGSGRQTNPPSGGDSGQSSTPSNDGGFPQKRPITDIIRENMALVIVSIIAVGVVIFAVIALKKPKPTVTPPPVGPTQVTYPPPAPNPNPYTPTQPTPNPYTPTQPTPNPFTPTQPVNIPQNLFLSCKGGHYDGQQIPLRGSYITMGREPDNTIKFPDDYQAVSRHHAILRFENGILTLEDTSSTGTYLKRIQGKIPPRQQIRIDVGDVFYLGERKNRFEVMRMG